MRYTASLSQSQGRLGYSIIFRHPVRHDATGKLGIRVRRGLGTRDRAEAERLRGQLDELLADERYRSSAAREDAERRFDSRVVDIFYDKVIPEERDFAAVREGVVPLPNSEGDYRRVLLLGTTGAGKTTLVRQLIGTDPDERFPSTSTARTTVHDTEIVIDEGPWRVVVTFVPMDELREYLNECISAAALAAWRGESPEQVRQRLLDHVDQRYRFSYVLGRGSTLVARDDADDEDDADDQEDADDLDDDRRPRLDPVAPEDLGDVDLDATHEILVRSVERLRDLVHHLDEQLRDDFETVGETDRRVSDELLEEEMDTRLRDEDAVHEIADELIDEIEKRFDLLPRTGLRRTKQGWPLAWEGHWDAHERDQFFKAISRFSSNYAPLFGRLLTPLVNGLRVAGPLCPAWADERPRLVLFDGEGLGHTPKSSAVIPTAVSQRIEEADAVFLVDSAAQPMQAAPVAVMREVAFTGNAGKLIFAFTHFDQVQGDNLPKFSDREHHVRASAENVLRSIGEDLGSFAERALRMRLQTGCFFFGRIHDRLREQRKADRRTIKQLSGLIEAVTNVSDRPAEGQARPVYERTRLILAVQAATRKFHDAWFARLGLNYRPGIDKEHWTRVKALARRLAAGMADEYRDLKPVAHLATVLNEQIYIFLQSPREWRGGQPSDDDDRQVVYDALADHIAGNMRRLATSRVWKQHGVEWRDAYSRRGKGSTFVRARIIGNDIYDRAAPVPDAIPSPDRNELLRLVEEIVDHACAELGACLR